MSFFTTDFMADEYDSSLSQSPQGQLSSQYTAALAGALVTEADFVGFLAYMQALDGGADQVSAIEQGLAVKALVEAGSFTLSNLFGAAQTKLESQVGSIDPTNPTPTLTVVIGDTTVSIDLTAMMDPASLDTESWSQTDVAKKITQTIYHIREFFTGTTQPDGYSEDWSNPPDGPGENQAPTADPIVVAFTETQKQANDGFSVADGWSPDPDNGVIDLLEDANADDADGDVLSVVDGSVTLVNGDPLPDYISYNNGVLTVDKNHESLDDLLQGEQRVIEIKYTITDGQAEKENTVTITLNGTADLFTDGELSATQVVNGVEHPGTANPDPTPFSFDLGAAEGAFNFSGIATVSVTADIDRNNEIVTVSLEGGASADFTQGSGGPGNDENGTTTVTKDIAFASSDDLIGGSFTATQQVNSVITIGVNATYDYWA